MKKQNLIYGILGVLLLCSIGYNFFIQNKANTEIEQKNVQISFIDSSKNELQKEYENAIVRLDDAQLTIDNLKTSNYETNKELNSLKKKIKFYLGKEKLSKKEAKSTKKLISELKLKIDWYIKENEKLKIENNKLSEDNRNLKMQNNLLEKVISTTKEENKELQDKFDLGSTLTVSNVSVKSLNYNDNKTKVAVKVKKLRLTFTINENRISNNGKKTIYLVLVNPLGKVIEGKEKTDVLSTKNDGEKEYTSKTDVDYTTGLIKNVEFDTDFSKILVDGLYKIELYENGYKINETKLALKKKKILGFF